MINKNIRLNFNRFVDDRLIVTHNGKEVQMLSCNGMPEDEARSTELRIV